MHPIIRIISFLIVAAFLALGGGQVFLLVAFGVVLALMNGVAPYIKSAWPLMRRMRWFFFPCLSSISG